MGTVLVELVPIGCAHIRQETRQPMTLLTLCDRSSTCTKHSPRPMRGASVTGHAGSCHTGLGVLGGSWGA